MANTPVVMGGKIYDIPELNFLALERAWPFLEQALSSPNPMVAVSSAIRVIAAGLIEAPHFKPELYGIDEDKLDPTTDREDQLFELTHKFLKKQVLATEIPNIQVALEQISKEAGLEGEEGEDLEEENPSPEIAAPSSSNLSPQELKEDPGTE